jgi:PAS domain S-box-containing protein
MEIPVNSSLGRHLGRYTLAVVVVAGALLLRSLVVYGLGLQLPLFILLYPAVMLVAILAGFWPGILATTLAALGIDYLFLPPFGSLALATTSDFVALTLFVLMGVFINLVVERYRRSVRSISTYKAELALWKSEDKLRQASEYQRLALEAAELGAWEVHLESRALSGDSICRRFYGLPMDQPITTLEFVLSRVHPDDRAATETSFQKALAGNGDEIWNHAYRVVWPDDTIHWLTSSGRVHAGSTHGDLHPTRFLGVTLDITEARQAEASAEASRAMLLAALNSTPDAVLIADLDRRIVHINEAFAAFHKFASKEECPCDLDEYERMFEVCETDGTAVPETMWSVSRALRGETIQNAEYRLRRKDTGESWVASYSFNPVRDKQGKIFQAVIVARDITELKDVEQKMRESACTLSLMYQNMHDIVFYMDVEPGEQFRFHSINLAFLRATGLGSEQVEGKLAQEVIPEPSRSMVLDRYREAVRERKTVFWEETTPYPTGEKHADVSVTPISDDQGTCTNLIGVIHDTTERHQAEKSIRKLNRVYAVLSGINETIVRESDSQTMLQAACSIAVEKGEFRMAWIGMVNPEVQLLESVACSGNVDGYMSHLHFDLRDPAHYDGPLIRCVQTSQHSICNDIEHDPGYAIWRDNAMKLGFRSSAGFPLIVDGQVAGVFSLYSAEPGFFADDEISLLDEMAMDISFALEVNEHEKVRRKAEEELRWRTAFFEAQVDSSLDGVLVVDTQNRKILQNQRLNEIMRIPKNIVDDPDDSRQMQYVRTIVKDPDEFTEKVEYLNSHPDEIIRDEIELLDGTIFDRYSAPVRDKFGNDYGRIWTFRDLTQRRQLEEQFRQAQKMESIGQLTGGIAHDFNNLLTVIQGCAEFLGEEIKDNPRQSEMSQMILEAAQRGADLTHRMLAFARRQTLQPQTVDVNGLITNLESFLRRTLSADIDLLVIPAPVECKALIDPTELESALLNLCVNARDAMPGGGTLIVETGLATLEEDYTVQNPDVLPGEYVLVAVSDTGCGIAPENIDRVFDPFFTTKSVGHGTGLGLSMVYGFAKQSRGHVKIYSEPDRGTSVKLYLPIAARNSQSIQLGQQAPLELCGSELILLVEDNAPVREYVLVQLHYLGYRVLEAPTPMEALEILRQHSEIDLLFTDVVMPGMNGHELATAACNLKPGLKVLYCSGYAEHAALRQGALEGSFQLLSKPYSRLDLARKIRTVLDAGNPDTQEGTSHA